MVDLLGYPADEIRAVKARQEIIRSGVVPAILSQQSKSGKWNGERSYYTPKYISTHWSLTLLTELGVDGSEPRFLQGVQTMLDATAKDLDTRLDKNTCGLSCFWGNLLRYALNADMAGDNQVEKVIHFAALCMQDGACRCEHNWGYECAWGVVRILWGLAAIPKAQRTPETNEAVTRGVKFLLDSFQLIEANYPTSETGSINPIWFKLNFPLFYQVDILFSLRVLDELNMLDHPSVQAALDWLEQRRGRSGHWAGSSPFRQRTWRELGDREETDRWVSLQATRILQHAGRLAAFNAVE
jgi:hypothetical protein